MRTKLLATACVAAAFFANAALATGDYLNGQPMFPDIAAQLAASGATAGDYRVDQQGFVYMPGQSPPFTRLQLPPMGHRQGPIASGQAYPDGSNSVYIPDPSGAPGFSAGRHSDGCIYLSSGYSPNC